MKCEFAKETNSWFYDEKARQLKINWCIYEVLNGWLEFIKHLYQILNKILLRTIQKNCKIIFKFHILMDKIINGKNDIMIKIMKEKKEDWKNYKRKLVHLFSF